MSDDYDFCPKCGRFGKMRHHKCPPVFECTYEDWPTEWTRVYATSEKWVAEEYVKRQDRFDGEFTEASRVRVRNPGEESSFRTYKVTAYLERVYQAELVEEGDDDEQAT